MKLLGLKFSKKLKTILTLYKNLANVYFKVIREVSGSE